MMNKKKKIFIGAGIVVGIAVIYFVYQMMTYVTTDNAQIQASSVLIASRVSGYVTKVNVEEGMKVKANDVLVEIDPRDYQNSLAQVKAQLLSNAAHRIDAEKNYHRIAQLYKQNAVAQQQFDQATATYNAVKAQDEALNAQVAQAEINLENTKVRAPSDGFIAKKSAEVGQLAAPGVPLIGFVDNGKRWIIGNLKETELEGVKPGCEVEIDVDAVSGKTYHGKVDSIMAATGATFTLLPPDNATGNFTKVVQRVPIRVVFDNLTPADMDLLRAGLSANLKIRKKR
jgi:membrane fusion protein (multidrug efflux system)